MASLRVWHISGANTGFGLELAMKALLEGDKVIAAVRSPSKAPEALKHPNVQIMQFDLGWSQEEMNSYAEKAVAAYGRLDVLVNNAAYAYMGAIEESEDAAVKAQFDTNVFAVLRIIRATLPHLRAQGSGTIMNLSSIGGLQGYPSNGIYCATKFAIEGLTQSLAQEVAPFGISAVIVEPGYFRTSFLSGPAAGGNLAPALEVYNGTLAHEARDNFAKYNGKQMGNPKKGAARIWEYIANEGLFKGKKKLIRLPLGSDTGAVIKATSLALAETAEEYAEILTSTDFAKGEE